MINKIVTLGDVCNKGSSNIAQKDLVDRDGIYPIYGAAGYIKNVDFAHQDKPYLAVVKDGAGIGRVMKLPANSSIIGTMQYILPKGNIDIDYLYFALQYMNLSKYFSGSTIPHIYFRDYQKEKLPLPELSEQQRKAYVLLRIEQLILSIGKLVEARNTSINVTRISYSPLCKRITIVDSLRTHSKISLKMIAISMHILLI